MLILVINIWDLLNTKWVFQIPLMQCAITEELITDAPDRLWNFIRTLLQDPKTVALMVKKPALGLSSGQ